MLFSFSLSGKAQVISVPEASNANSALPSGGRSNNDYLALPYVRLGLTSVSKRALVVLDVTYAFHPSLHFFPFLSFGGADADEASFLPLPVSVPPCSCIHLPSYLRYLSSPSHPITLFLSFPRELLLLRLAAFHPTFLILIASFAVVKTSIAWTTETYLHKHAHSSVIRPHLVGSVTMYNCRRLFIASQYRKNN